MKSSVLSETHVLITGKQRTVPCLQENSGPGLVSSYYDTQWLHV